MTDQWLALFVLIAVALGLQLVLSIGQAMSFTRAIHALRVHGQVATGMGGGKWFGRKVFVALAADPDGTVVQAIRLRGLTQFARPQPAPHFVGLTIRRIADETAMERISSAERAAARQAAQTLDAADGLATASGATKGEEQTSI